MQLTGQNNGVMRHAWTQTSKVLTRVTSVYFLFYGMTWVVYNLQLNIPKAVHCKHQTTRLCQLECRAIQALSNVPSMKVSGIKRQAIEVPNYCPFFILTFGGRKKRSFNCVTGKGHISWFSFYHKVHRII